VWFFFLLWNFFPLISRTIKLYCMII
jgi:hypothetical protein